MAGAIIVSNAAPFGAMSNTMIDNIQSVTEAIDRLQAAAAAASSGYGGTAGTEFETGTNFGVTPDATPGQQGAAWQFALGNLYTAWQNFLTAAQASITALDNG
jgi:hypothetical protein